MKVLSQQIQFLDKDELAQVFQVLAGKRGYQGFWVVAQLLIQRFVELGVKVPREWEQLAVEELRPRTLAAVELHPEWFEFEVVREKEMVQRK